jgi:transketolase
MAGFTFTAFDMAVMGNARELVPMKIKEMMEKDPDIFYVASDSIIKGTAAGDMLERFPDRTIDVGIAEPNLVGTAAGIALAGKKVFGSAFGPFLCVRATDQIYLDVAYNDVPVCLIGTHGGLTSGGGPTHYTILDSAIMRSIPNMIMVVPADANQSAKVVEEFLRVGKPVYMRLARGDEPLVYSDQKYPFEFGKAITAKEGQDITIIGAGIGVYNGLVAAQELEKEGIKARVLDMFTIKPIDEAAVIAAARETGIIVTVEDHNIIGGLGSAVADVLAGAGIACKFKKLGVPDVFAKLGYAEDLYPYYGYDGPGIAKVAKGLLKK